MLVAVTGAAGHIGANLVRALLAAGRRVRALVYEDHRSLAGLAVEEVVADVRDPAALRAALAGADVVYHLAARIALWGEGYEALRPVNVGGTANVLAACRAAGVRRLVHMSSIHARRQAPQDEPLDETRPFVDDAAALAYDRTKAEAERLVLAERGLEVVVVSPTAVVGPHDYKPSAMGRAVLLLRDGGMPMLLEGGFDFVDVRDVVAGTIAAAERARPGERYLLPGHYTTVRELAGVVAAAGGRRPPRLMAPMWLARLGAPFVLAASRITGGQPVYTPESLEVLRTGNRRIVGAKAARELGFAARPFAATIADTLRWFSDRAS
ncbi:MAG TPA: NAD-dependent epimerase/dehydratase family protein [Polyangia bacterium]|jgi:dihydroflavonol-4-reductase